MDLGIFVDILRYLFRSRTQPAKPSKAICFTMNFIDLTIQRSMTFDAFHDLFRYQFWHSLSMIFGIDFVSILEAFCINFHEFG